MNDDLISRQAAIDAICKHGTALERKGILVLALVEHKSMTIDLLESLPSAQPTEASCWGCNCPKIERLNRQKTFSEMVRLHDAERRTDDAET